MPINWTLANAHMESTGYSFKIIPDVNVSRSLRREVFRPPNAKRTGSQKCSFIFTKAEYDVFLTLWNQAKTLDGVFSNFPIIMPAYPAMLRVCGDVRIASDLTVAQITYNGVQKVEFEVFVDPVLFQGRFWTDMVDRYNAQERDFLLDSTLDYVSYEPPRIIPDHPGYQRIIIPGEGRSNFHGYSDISGDEDVGTFGSATGDDDTFQHLGVDYAVDEFFTNGSFLWFSVFPDNDVTIGATSSITIEIEKDGEIYSTSLTGFTTEDSGGRHQRWYFNPISGLGGFGEKAEEWAFATGEPFVLRVKSITPEAPFAGYERMVTPGVGRSGFHGYSGATADPSVGTFGSVSGMPDKFKHHDVDYAVDEFFTNGSLFWFSVFPDDDATIGATSNITIEIEKNGSKYSTTLAGFRTERTSSPHSRWYYRPLSGLGEFGEHAEEWAYATGEPFTLRVSSSTPTRFSGTNYQRTITPVRLTSTIRGYSDIEGYRVGGTAAGDDKYFEHLGVTYEVNELISNPVALWFGVFPNNESDIGPTSDIIVEVEQNGVSYSSDLSNTVVGGVGHLWERWYSSSATRDYGDFGTYAVQWIQGSDPFILRVRSLTPNSPS